MMTLRKFSTSLLAVGMLFASSVFAQQAGDNMISLGVNYITPKINNSNPSVVGSDNAGGLIVSRVQSGLNGTTASVNNAFVGTISYARMLTDNWAGELQLGLPPTMNLNLNTPNATNSKTGSSAPTHNNAASAKFFAPVVMAKYYFGEPKDALRPYLGVGATYVSFHNVQINAGDQVVSDIAGQGANLKSAWAPVFNAGALYNIDQSWFIQGGMAYVPIKTTLTMNGVTNNPPQYGGGSAATTTTSSINFNTLEYVFKLGYKF